MCSKSSHSGEPQRDVLAVGMRAVIPLPLSPLLSAVPLPANSARLPPQQKWLLQLFMWAGGSQFSLRETSPLLTSVHGQEEGRRGAMTVISRSAHQPQWLRAESELTRKSIYETEEGGKIKKKTIIILCWNAYLRRRRQLLMSAETQAWFITAATA